MGLPDDAVVVDKDVEERSDLPVGGDDVVVEGLEAQEDGVIEDWRLSVTQELRNHLRFNFVQAIFPVPDLVTALNDPRVNNLLNYARQVETDFYDSANCREEYHQLLAEKIQNIQQQLEEKRQQRLQKQQQISSNTNH